MKNDEKPGQEADRPLVVRVFLRQIGVPIKNAYIYLYEISFDSFIADGLKLTAPPEGYLYDIELGYADEDDDDVDDDDNETEG